MITNKKISECEIEGFIVPAERDKSGNVIQVCIETPDFERYILDNNDYVKTLFQHSHQKVKIIGKILDSELGNPVIQVIQFELIPL